MYVLTIFQAIWETIPILNCIKIKCIALNSLDIRPIKVPLAASPVLYSVAGLNSFPEGIQEPDGRKFCVHC